MFSLGKAVFVAIAAAALIWAGPVRSFAQGAAPVAPAQPDTNQGDAFGEEVTLTAKTIVVMNGTATWDTETPLKTAVSGRASVPMIQLVLTDRSVG